MITENGLEISFSVDGKKMKAGLDTGANLSFIFQEITPQLSSSEEVVTLNNLMIGEFFLKSYIFFSMYKTSGPTTDMILGYDFFLKHIIFIDFDNQKIWVQPL